MKNTDKIAKVVLSWQLRPIFVSINQNNSLNVAALPEKQHHSAHVTALHQQSLHADCCSMEGWHFHPSKSCSHAGTYPSFDKTNSIRTVKIPHCQTDIFPPQYVYESITGRNCIFLLIWKPQGFSAPCRGKKKQLMSIFSEPCCLTQETGKNRNFHNSNDSFYLLLTIYFILLHHILWKRNKKSVVLYAWKRKINMCFL